VVTIIRSSISFSYSNLSPQVGDGTTSIVLLATEILKLCKPFVEEGVHPQIIVRGLKKASKIVCCEAKCVTLISLLVNRL